MTAPARDIEPPDAARAIDGVCDRFEVAWKRGDFPPLADYLADAEGEHRADLFRELLHLDLFYRAAGGKEPSRDYAARFPDLVHVLADVVGESPGDITVDRVAPPEPDGYHSPRTEAPGPRRLAPKGPDRIPGYEILGTLGRGGMGVVYKARQTGAGRFVALKMMLSGAHADDEERARFRAEAHAMARLRHPGVVQIFEVGEQDGQPFFSMEYCEDGSLDGKLGGNPLPGRDAAGLIARLADAVHEAHRANIVHRDLKPGNVLLQRKAAPRPSPARPANDSGTGTVPAKFDVDDFELKVTDFGLAKKLDIVGPTLEGAVLGTPSYMAPEQAEGKTDIGPLADVWALGSILYECLVGRPPFKGATALDTMAQVVMDEPVRPRRLVPRLDRDLETIALKCLSKSPGQRYAGAADLAADLRRFLDGEVIRARPVGQLDSLRRWVKRRPAWAGMIAFTTLAALSLLAGTVYGSWAISASRTSAALDQARAFALRLEIRRRQDATDAERFHALLRKTRDLTASSDAGWSVRALEHAREAAGLDYPAKRFRAELVTDLSNALLGWDAQPLGTPADTPDGYCSDWRAGGKEVAVGQGRQVALSYCKIWIANADTGKRLRELSFLPDIQFRIGKVPKLDGVAAVAFSPDGRRLAAAARNGGVWLWDLDRPEREGKKVIRLTRGDVSVGFDAGGGILVCGDQENLVSWSVADGKELSRRFVSKAGAMFGRIAIDPRGGRLAVHDENRIEFLCTRRLTPVAPPLPVMGFPAFSPDGRTLAVHLGRDVRLFVADEPTTEPVATLRVPNGEQADDDDITGTIFSPDGSLLLTLSEHGRHARLWEVAGGRLAVTIGTAGELTGGSFSPDGKNLLLQADGQSSLHAIRGGHFQRFVASGPSACEALSFGADGTLAVRSQSTSDRDWATLSLWSPGHPPAFRARVTLNGLGPANPVMAFSPSGELAFLRTDHRICFWDGKVQAHCRDVPWQKDPDHLAFASAGRLWASDGPVVGVVGNDDVQWTNSIFLRKRGATSLAADPTRLVSGWRDGTIRIHGEDAKPRLSRAHSPSPIHALALSPDASCFAAGTNGGEVTVCRTEDLAPVAGTRDDDRHRGGVTGLAFLGPNLLLSAGMDGRIALWEFFEGNSRLVSSLQLPRPVRAMAVHAGTGRVAVLLDRERAVRLIDLFGLLRELDGFGVHEEALNLLPPPADPLPPAPPRPAFAGVDPPAGPNGLRAELFADPWFEQRVKVRHDTRFGFDWGTDLPDRAVPGPLFAVRWTGWLVPPKPGKVRLWARCDGKTWVRPWKGNSPHDCYSIGHLADLELNYEGKPLPIRIDFAKTQPKAAFVLEWSCDGSATREAIPPEVLFHTEADALRTSHR